MDQAKLARLQAAVKIGGKGTPRRKVIKKSASSSQADDVKLHNALKKLQVATIGPVDEVNMFQEDGKVLHFQTPQVHAALPSNTTVVYGVGKPKEITELLPNILSQLGPESLRKLADSYQQIMEQRKQMEGADAEKAEDEGVPSQVESFEVEDEANKLDELN
ncbi:nascent polypeptide-associated complex subunit beta [Phaffia rhodozyma]|uniref:Nascent polypeptide-associated complex subunit beta n=1 Tax=Phaffia rhodozyma TaxID=264483 RepID=A0A0F7SK58_PHARH|nr:nascent polypeptide-associated complex subunit beta [Phaffia rhodozyma]